MNEKMQEIIDLDEKIRELTIRRDDLIAEYFKKHGEEVEIGLNPMLEKPWVRAKIVDNLAELQEKGVVFRQSALPRFSLKVDHLKNKPQK